MIWRPISASAASQRCSASHAARSPGEGGLYRCNLKIDAMLLPIQVALLIRRCRYPVTKINQVDLSQSMNRPSMMEAK
jgi:hypothetical protein